MLEVIACTIIGAFVVYVTASVFYDIGHQDGKDAGWSAADEWHRNGRPDITITMASGDQEPSTARCWHSKEEPC